MGSRDDVPSIRRMGQQIWSLNHAQFVCVCLLWFVFGGLVSVRGEWMVSAGTSSATPTSGVVVVTCQQGRCLGAGANDPITIRPGHIYHIVVRHPLPVQLCLPIAPETPQDVVYQQRVTFGGSKRVLVNVWVEESGNGANRAWGGGSVSEWDLASHNPIYDASQSLVVLRPPTALATLPDSGTQLCLGLVEHSPAIPGTVEDGGGVEHLTFGTSSVPIPPQSHPSPTRPAHASTTWVS